MLAFGLSVLLKRGGNTRHLDLVVIINTFLSYLKMTSMYIDVCIVHRCAYWAAAEDKSLKNQVKSLTVSSIRILVNMMTGLNFLVYKILKGSTNADRTLHSLSRSEYSDLQLPTV